MPSLNEKLSMLADSYEHSKNSPAYRDLKIKYKALKAQNQELLNLIARLCSGGQVAQNIEVAKEEGVKRFSSQTVETDSAAHSSENSRQPSSQSPAFFAKPVSRQYVKEIVPVKLECNNAVNIIEEDIDLELDSDIKEQIIEELAAEDFMIRRGTETDYDESDEVEAEDHEVDKPANNAGLTEEGCLGFSCTLIVKEDPQNEITIPKTEVVIKQEIVEDEEEEEIEVIEVEEEIEVVEEEEEEETEVIEVEEEEETEEDEEAGVYEIEFNGKRYYTTNEQNGIVYELIGDDDVGDEIGKFVNGKLVLNK
jgi:hypothetical protein